QVRRMHPEPVHAPVDAQAMGAEGFSPVDECLLHRIPQVTANLAVPDALWDKVTWARLKHILRTQGNLLLAPASLPILHPDEPPPVPPRVLRLFLPVPRPSLAHAFVPSSSLNSLYSTASTNASQDASMMFSLTPTVPQTLPWSRHSTTTRTRA